MFVFIHYIIFFFFFFFFSSRRRHTRYIGDWSSDVCSSDLRILRHVLGLWAHLALDARLMVLHLRRLLGFLSFFRRVFSGFIGFLMQVHKRPPGLPDERFGARDRKSVV